ncbi:MAG: hypothetical protein CVV34_05485, partial [Methanomicrobiales archaeon HGW-Methanomicrobiales-5]
KTPIDPPVPDLIGMTKEAALSALQKLGIEYKVKEKVYDDVAAGIVAEQTPQAGSETTAKTVVTVVVSKGTAADKAPVPSFTFTPVAPKSGDKLTFDASASTDDGTIAKYSWEFGDGTPIASGKTATHTYTAPGTYTVVLWVTDDKGQAASLTQTVLVK